VSDAGLWVNLFVASNTTVKFGKVDVPVAMESNYPWEGNVSVTVNPKSAVAFSMNVRIPGWARGEVAPGELYSFEDKSTANFVITVNGKPAAFTMNQGYATINRTWKKGDKVELVLPMEVRRIISRPELKQDVERVALQRGPLVYCVEGADNNGKAWDLILPDGAAFKTAYQKDLLEGVTTIQFQAPTVQISGDGQTVTTEVKTITAIPYYAWCNRGQNPMQVWLPRKIKDIKINN
jgi:DUF1680 family protein